MVNMVRVLVTGLGLMAGSAYADVSHIDPYRGAQLVKSVSQESSTLVIPLGKIQRSGRGWEPESVLRVKGSAVNSLYKIDRNVPLDAVISYYRDALLDHGANTLFQCESRACGSSNAWANNFFDDYLLYGADNSQYMLVTQDQDEDYQVMYINRRGAGDILVRIDHVAIAATQGVGFDIVAQMSVDDLPRIRRFLRDLPSSQQVVGFVTSQKDSSGASIAQGDVTIAALQSGIGELLNKQVRFINLANMGREALGQNRVSFVYVTP